MPAPPSTPSRKPGAGKEKKTGQKEWENGKEEEGKKRPKIKQPRSAFLPSVPFSRLAMLKDSSWFVVVAVRSISTRAQPSSAPRGTAKVTPGKQTDDSDSSETLIKEGGGNIESEQNNGTKNSQPQHVKEREIMPEAP